jgi:nicotinate-nucleotide--dimethylbenzimidazole phosphoribosyltransferase
MSERECAATMAFGMETLAKQPDLLILGAFGPGTDEAAGALIGALTSLNVPDGRSRVAIDRAKAQTHGDPLELLRHLGGRESAALAGAILAARTQRTPVLLDGLPSVAAAAVLATLDPAVIDHCRLAGPNAAARGLALAPVSDLDLGLDGGVGGLAALSLIKLACALAEDPGI